MFADFNQTDWIVLALWALYLLLALSPLALLFISRQGRRPGRIGPSMDSVALALQRLTAKRWPKPPPSQRKPLAAAVQPMSVSQE